MIKLLYLFIIYILFSNPWHMKRWKCNNVIKKNNQQKEQWSGLKTRPQHQCPDGARRRGDAQQKRGRSTLPGLARARHKHKRSSCASHANRIHKTYSKSTGNTPYFIVEYLMDCAQPHSWSPPLSSAGGRREKFAQTIFYKPISKTGETQGFSVVR